MSRWRAAVGLSGLLLAGCSSLFAGGLAEEPIPLADMEEPLPLHDEPDDEAERRELPLGAFTGVTVVPGAASLDDLEEGAGGLRVSKVVENSPGDAAGLAEDDLLLEVTSPPELRRELSWPSDWRKTELDAAPGSVVVVEFDRAGRVGTARITAAPRVRTPSRTAAERLREEDRVGVVVRTATEVEARTAGLAPGAGAVVVGLSARSPWRRAGLVFGDLIARVGDEDVAHPQVVLDRIREAEEDAVVGLTFVRDGETRTVRAPLSSRASHIQRVDIPFLFTYEADRGASEWSLLFGLLSHRTTPVAWEWSLLGLLDVRGGDSDLLEEVGGE